MNKLTKEALELEKSLSNSTNLDEALAKIICCSSQMLAIKANLPKIAASDLPVLILGETGTGKELIAKALHGNRVGQFVPVNCSAIPSELLESELFGSEVGSFTGAKTKPGLVQIASGGTLFLDEIGELSLALQAKLLRFVQENKARRVGGKEEYETNCRFISATNLLDIESSPKFRTDLYYRIAVLEIVIPPLRERLQDAQLIANNILGNDLIFPTDLLANNPWKGNIRELINFVQRYKFKHNL